MTVWHIILTIFNQRRALQFAGLYIAIAVIVTSVLIPNTATAQSTNKTINFQGRLLTPAGAVVPDGYYNMQFKIYTGGPGDSAGNPGGSLAWTESRINNGGTSGVRVRGGFFAVSLGSVNPFGSSVNWDHDTLWLSMNIAGSMGDCSAFGSGECVADGEMLPMTRITAVPYALNAGALGGKAADNFVQLAQGVQIDASTNTSSIFINKTGSGNLMQLQNSAIDVFTVSDTGNLTLGSSSDKSISIATSEDDMVGRQLAITAGSGGAGAGADGGDLIIQGGSAGGTNGDGGDVRIDAGAATGTGANGVISIGGNTASTIEIGSNTTALRQDIAIGTNNTAGSTSNVTIGAGEGADGGTTAIQAKNAVTIATNGTTRAVFSDTTSTVYFGNGVSSAAPSDSVIQGTDSTANAVAGGSLTVQGGNATAGNTNGGNVILSGGSGSGSGASGLVIMNTPTFSTTTNDPNCYAGGLPVATSCSITQSSIDNSAAVIIGFSAAGQVATVPTPTITTPGRILYIMASGDSQTFTLQISPETAMSMRANSAASLIWNGSAWLSSGGSGGATIQDAYTNSTLEGGNAELLVQTSSGSGSLAIRDSGQSNSEAQNTLLEVQNSNSGNVFSVNAAVRDGTELAADGTVSDAANFATNWSAVGNATATRSVTDGQAGTDSAQITDAANSGDGVRSKLATAPQPEKKYRISVYTKLLEGSDFNDFTIQYSPDGGTTFTDCTEYNGQSVPNSGWTLITCSLQTSAVTASDPYVYFTQASAPAASRTFLIDTFSFTAAPEGVSNVKIGGDQESPTLFTVDKSSGAPNPEGDHEAMLGSMYYDTTIGKLQCYEADGWGDCGAKPDNFVTLTPEYQGAVTHGDGIGDISSGFCSDALSINDGSNSQPAICSSNETQNFYGWTSPEVTQQTKSIFVTYKLPANFKQFIPGLTSLMSKTDSANSSVTYHVYRNGSGGLIACGSAVGGSSGAQATWQKTAASGGSDPSACGFTAEESLVVRIDLAAAEDAHAYISDLGFTFSSH